MTEEVGGCTDFRRRHSRLAPTPKPGLGFGAHPGVCAVCSPLPQVSGKAPLTWVEDEGNLNWNFPAATAATPVLISENDVAPGKLKALERSGPKQ